MTPPAAAAKGRARIAADPDVRQRIGQRHPGKAVSDRTRQRLSEAHRGKPKPPGWGRGPIPGCRSIHMRGQRGHHALVTGHANDKQAVDLHVCEQQLHGRTEECRVLGLENEVVRRLWMQRRRDLRRRATAGQRLGDQRPKIGTPTSQVVVGIDHRHARVDASRLHATQCGRDGQRTRQRRTSRRSSATGGTPSALAWSLSFWAMQIAHGWATSAEARITAPECGPGVRLFCTLRRSTAQLQRRQLLGSDSYHSSPH